MHRILKKGTKEASILRIFTVTGRNLLRFISYSMLMMLTVAVVLVNGPVPAPVSAAAGIPLPIIMYHSVLRDPTRTSKYVITPESLSADLSYLHEHGYTTVLPSQVIAYARGEGELPERPVMLTFDDGYLNNLLYLPELLEQHDACALVSIVGDYAQRFTDLADPNPNYAHMTWDELNDLVADGRIELGNHSYSMHYQGRRMGAMRIRGEDDAQFRAVFTADAQKLQDALLRHCAIAPAVYAYPYGFIDRDGDEVLRDIGFSMSLSCYELTSHISRDPLSLWSLGRYNRAGTLSTPDFMKKAGIS